MGANFKWETLQDLGDQWRLSVACRCGHAAALDPKRLARWYFCHGWGTRKHEIARHLRCAQCHGRGRDGRLWIGITIGRPTSDPFPKNEEGWKFLVRRLRNR